MAAGVQWQTWAWQWISTLRRELNEGGLNQSASGLVYCSLLSLAPLLAVSFALFKAFGLHNELEPLLLEALAPLGGQAGQVTSHIIGFVENVQVGVLGSLGLATLFYTVVSLLGKIEETFNHIWRVSQPRFWARRFSDYLSVVVVGPLLLFSGVGITASMSSNALVRRLIALEPFGTAYYLAGLVLPYLLVSAAFAFGYVFIPNTRVRIRAALVGGLVAGVGWKLSGSLFTALVADSAQYSAIYSGFAVVLVFMIWVYLSWVIVLLGGAVAFYCQYPTYLRYGGRRPRLSTIGRERLGVLMMVLVGRSQLAGEPAWNLHRLAAAADLPWEIVQKVLDALLQGGLLRVLDHESEAYVLARDTDRILLQDIIRALRSQGEAPDFALGRAEPAIGRLLAQVGADCAGLAGRRSLREIVDECAGEPGGKG